MDERMRWIRTDYDWPDDDEDEEAHYCAFTPGLDPRFRVCSCGEVIANIDYHTKDEKEQGNG